MRQGTRLKPEERAALSAGVVLCELLSGCAVTPAAIRDLPELPAEYARDLTLARTAPVLMTKPAAVATVPQPSSTGPVFAIARACTNLYDGYVIYPITICYPPSEFYETLVVGAIEARGPNQKVPVAPTRYFRLSSHPQVRIGGPWFCTVRGGPWYAHVEGAQMCNINPNIRLFSAGIIGAPETVVVSWTGALTDVPPPLNLFGISPSGQSCVCCSGVMCPNGNCSTDLQHCGVGPAAEVIARRRESLVAVLSAGGDRAVFDEHASRDASAESKARSRTAPNPSQMFARGLRPSVTGIGRSAPPVPSARPAARPNGI